MRTFIALPLIAGVLSISSVLATEAVRPLFALPLALILGTLYSSLFFFGHELGHGAMVRSRLLQNLIMYLTFMIFCLSPHLWLLWHNRIHHAYTNCANYDPDNFGDVEYYGRFPSTNFLLKFAPGSGHWLSTIYFPTWFTIHAQGVLWIKSRRMAAFSQLKKTRAATESALMASIWIMIGITLGAWRSLVIIVLPMVTANTIVMAYISTNHLLRPLVEGFDVLESSMSVTTCRLLDRLHFHFSHHVEHHLFPSMSTAYAPLVRSALFQLGGERYFAPSHLRALILLFRTPRIYDGASALVDPRRGRSVRFADIDAGLRGDVRLTRLGQIGGATASGHDRGMNGRQTAGR